MNRQRTRFDLRLPFSSCLPLALAGCGFSARNPAVPPGVQMVAPAAAAQSPAAAPPTLDAGVAARTPGGVAGEVLAAMDRTVSPCQDFYQYACGGWLKSTTLPPDRARYGRGFSVIYERNLESMRAILEDLARA